MGLPVREIDRRCQESLSRSRCRREEAAQERLFVNAASCVGALCIVGIVVFLFLR